MRYCSGKHQVLNIAHLCMKYGFELLVKIKHLQAAHWRSGSSSHKVLCQQLEASGKDSELGDSSKHGK